MVVTRKYRYLGDRHTEVSLKGKECIAVRRPDDKTIRGRNGNMLVQFDDGKRCVIIGRQLRKVAETWQETTEKHHKPCKQLQLF
jgi:hypothetical protein